MRRIPPRFFRPLLPLFFAVSLLAAPEGDARGAAAADFSGPAPPRSPVNPRVPRIPFPTFTEGPDSGVQAASSVSAANGGGHAGFPDLAAMIGQMIMIGFNGTELRDDDPLLESIRAGRAGNVILFERGVTGGGKNIVSPAQLRLLTARLQKAAPRPLFIAADQEGGRVQRLRPERGFEGGESAAALGRGDPDATRQAARRVGLEMAALGLNFNFAPVADLNLNPLSPAIGALGRSFGANPERTAAHVIAFGEGLAKAGVAPCLKHFPGHGSAWEDSHERLPDISSVWRPAELVPFREAIRQGWPGAVMPGHLRHRGLDPFRPASLSAHVLNGLLRGKMGFAGVIVSDDMQMGALDSSDSLEERILLAVEAGVDMLLFSNNSRAPEVGADEIHAILLRLARQGRISPARIKLSFERVSGLKRRFAGWKP